MATTQKGLAARLTASAGAIVLASMIALGGALPASAAEPGNINPATDRSLTVHKFTQTAESLGLPNDGSALTTDQRALLTGPLSGVEFTVRQVPGINLTTNAGWAAAQALTVGAAQSAVAGETAAPNVNSWVGSTDGGSYTFSDLPLGVFLVTETAIGTNPIAVRTPPFLVSLPLPLNNEWLYDVNVYPKNSVGSIEKTVDEGGAQELGDTVSWQIDSTVPFSPAGSPITSYSIEDALDARLTYTADSAVVRLGSLADLNAMTPPAATLLTTADYTLTPVGNTLTFAFTLDGLIKLNAADGQTVRIALDTTVTSVGNGVIVNGATAFVNGNTVDTDNATTYWGSVRVIKHAGNQTANRLDGATFELRNVNNATVPAPAGSVVATGVAAPDGVINFDGVITALDGTLYYLVETQAPTGYVRLTDATPITVMPGQPVEAQVNFAYVSNEQVPAYTLPITGGSGEAAFMIGGLGLIGTALGFVLIRRRKEQAEA
nr:SpaH/EbpB family LPXTG-anchored major pilin [Agrococcus sp. KRD186]